MGDGANQAAREGVPCIMEDTNTQPIAIDDIIGKNLWEKWDSTDSVNVSGDELKKQRLKNTYFKFVNSFGFKLKSISIAKKVLRYQQFYNNIPIYQSAIRVELDKKLDNPFSEKLSSVDLSPVDTVDFDGFKALVDQPLDIIDESFVKEIFKSEHSELKQVIDGVDLNPHIYYYYDQKPGKWRLVYITDCKLKNELGKEKTQDLSKLSRDLVDYVVDASTKEIVKTFPRARARAVC